MMDEKKYPVRELQTFKTSTVIPCAACKTAIAMFDPVVSDGVDYWHERCSPGTVMKAATEEDKLEEKRAGDKE